MKITTLERCGIPIYSGFQIIEFNLHLLEFTFLLMVLLLWSLWFLFDTLDLRTFDPRGIEIIEKCFDFVEKINYRKIFGCIIFDGPPAHLYHGYHFLFMKESALWLSFEY